MAKQDPLNQLKQAADEAAQTDALQQLAQTQAEQPSEGLLSRAQALFKRKAQQLSQSAESTLEQIEASLAFDSWGDGAPAFGMRGGMASERQILFSADSAEIDVQVTQPVPAEQALVQGQVMSDLDDDSLAGLEVVLVDSAGQARGRITDEVGSFTYSHCAPDTYTLTIHLPTETISGTFTIE